MEIEQRVLELGAGKELTLDATLRADEQRSHRGIEPSHGPGDRQPRVEMTACAASGDEDPHAASADESETRSLETRSDALPMLASMPVMNSDRTRLDRP